MNLGVCYYPEHWPEDKWADDARQMATLGLSRVRIGEFAWSKFEPAPGEYDWNWFDRAIDTLHAEKLGLILGTPTATPPKWLVEAHPDILANDAQGHPRRFGSRRHYCFSNETYRKECRQIVTEMVRRYGNHPGVVMWQIDNEYGCHDTVESYSLAAQVAFRTWLRERYRSVEALNEAWGTVFWSQTYRSFDEVDLPGATVTEANPSHRLDFQRFSSDQVVSFNREQVNIIRAHSPGREITHNFMGAFTAFDHHKLGADIDIATWDSYPLGFLDLMALSDEQKNHWLRQGHPDFQAFHHDLYRGCSQKWGVMEQQPGPVNWAPYNPAPLPGMVRLWSLEAIAHGADLVSWFRWRQVPFAQEHMHAGLQRPDGHPAPAQAEVRQVVEDLEKLGPLEIQRSAVALIVDYEGQWIHRIQPQGKGMDLFRQAFEAYSALRALGMSIDILPQTADLTGYELVVLTGNPILQDSLLDQLEKTGPRVLVLPRTGSKTRNFHIPPEMPPGRLQSFAGVKVTRVESLRPGFGELVKHGKADLKVVNWREDVEVSGTAIIRARFADQSPFWVENGRFTYLAGWPDELSLIAILIMQSQSSGSSPNLQAEPDVRYRKCGELTFVFNYGPEPELLADKIPSGAELIIGDADELPSAGVAVWRI